MNWRRLSCLFALTLEAATAFVAPRGAVVPAAPPVTRLHAQAPTPEVSVVSVRNLAVAGRVPWRKLCMDGAQRRKFLDIMRAETHVAEVVLMAALSLFTTRAGRFVYDRFLRRYRKDVEYEDSLTRMVTEVVQEASRIAVVCYLFDAAEVAMEVTGLKGKKMDVSTLLAKLIYATWACFKFRSYKNYLIGLMERGKGAQERLFEVFEKASDFVSFGVLALVWSDILKLNLGKGVTSVLALGGAGTLAVTLACQDLAKRWLNGLTLAASDAFNVGEYIMLGDGTMGRVVSLGWLHTDVLASDEKITRIPNNQLSDVRISNLSRLQFSQVKQKLRFAYKDLATVPALCAAIKDEIVASCPKAVTDGSRPLRVFWTDYAASHVEVVVDVRLRNPPSGDAYYEARQGVLEAIARAARARGVDFSHSTEISLGGSSAASLSIESKAIEDFR